MSFVSNPQDAKVTLRVLNTNVKQPETGDHYLKTTKWVLVARDDNVNNIYIQLKRKGSGYERYKLHKTIEEHVYQFTADSLIMKIRSNHQLFLPCTSTSNMYFDSLLDVGMVRTDPKFEPKYFD